MPVYEYECGRCGNFDHSQAMSDKPLSRCPKCGSRKVKRLISASSFLLKGGGWYSEGYQKKPSETGAKAPKEGAEPAKTEAPDKSGDSGKAGSSGKAGDSGKAGGPGSSSGKSSG